MIAITGSATPVATTYSRITYSLRVGLPAGSQFSSDARHFAKSRDTRSNRAWCTAHVNREVVMYRLGALLCCVVLSAADTSNLNDCTYKADDGSSFDLSPLIKG